VACLPENDWTSFGLALAKAGAFSIRNHGRVAGAPHIAHFARVSAPVKCVEIRIKPRCSVLWSLGRERLPAPPRK
jgi:hypothetical protein